MKLLSPLVSCLVALLILCAISGGAKAQQLSEAFTVPTEESTLILFELDLSSVSESAEVLLFDDSGETFTVNVDASSSDMPFANAELPSGAIESPVFGLIFGVSSGELISIVAVDSPIQITHDDLTRNEKDRLLDLCTNTYDDFGGNDFGPYSNNTDPKLPEGGD